MRTATPAVTQYVTCARRRRGRCRERAPMSRGQASPRSARSAPACAASTYATSPLLASQDAAVALQASSWRWSALGFCVLLGRAVYVQVIGNDFFQQQGEVRFARTLELPASRGRILDRNGLILASSVPAPSIWAIPKDVERRRPRSARQLAKLLDMTAGRAGRDGSTTGHELRLAQAPGRRAGGARVAALGIKGMHQRANTSASTPKAKPRRTWSASPTSKTSGQEGIELAFKKDLPAATARARVIKDRLGRVVEDVGEQVAAGATAATSQLSIDSKVQFFAYQRCATRWLEHKAKAGSVVVLDVQTGEVLALANYPSYMPGKRAQPDRRAAAQPRADRHLRARLDDEAVHRRPGRWRPAASRPSTRDPDRARPLHDRRLTDHATRTRTAR